MDAYGLGRQAVPGDLFHEVAEAIELAEGGVNIGCDADAFELLVQDRSRENAVLIEEITSDRVRIDARDIHVRDRTRLLRLERRVKANFRHVFQTIHPVTREIPESCLFALAADPVVKQ